MVHFHYALKKKKKLNASVTSCKLWEKHYKIKKESFDPNQPEVSPYSSPCYANMKAHYTLVEIYFWKDSYFTGHVVCMSYDMLVTMVKNELFFFKRSNFALLLNGISSILIPVFFQRRG